MRKLLGGLVIIILLVVAVGIWRGWFNYSMNKTDPERPSIEVNIDKGKLESDIGKGKQKLQESADQGKGALEHK
ncbi:MAG TPA: hypothetical protein VKS79_04595 [Gemmataceae bacterium]|nr:hypothetical protein [Gemmataceae bacterium]